MNGKGNPAQYWIIIVDDDFEDFLLIKETFEQMNLHIHLTHIEDGQTLINILKAQSENKKLGELPHVILLDLDMPKKNGLQVLKEIKANILLRQIPIIIFTTSTSSKDIEQAYELGASCYVAKPATAAGWTRTVGNLSRFWIEEVITCDSDGSLSVRK